jgi:hypothetical protein
MDVCYAWNCDRGKIVTKFSPTLCSGTTLHIRFAQKKHAVQKYTVLHTLLLQLSVLNTMLDTAAVLCE